MRGTAAVEANRGAHGIVELYATAHGLSEREFRLLLGTVEGASDKLIAATWGCSRSTVATYWKRIFAKTGLRPQRDVLADVLRFAGSLLTVS